jgi:hypothetical protein
MAKRATGDATSTSSAMTTPRPRRARAVDGKKVVSDKSKTKSQPVVLDLDDAPVCDPGASEAENIFIDDVLDTDEYDLIAEYNIECYNLPSEDGKGFYNEIWLPVQRRAEK